MEQADVEREKALTICGHALSLVSEAKDWTESGDGSQIGHWSNRRFRAALLVPTTSIEAAYLPHVLEVWEQDEKVLSACWGDPEEIEIRLLKPGNWQQDFLGA